MKKVSKTLAIVLCLVMILSLTAMANWTTIGGNNNHNGVVTSSPTSSNPSITEIALLNSGSGWDGVDTVPVMRTVTTTETNNDVTTTTTTTYAYVLYDGHAAGGHLAKINCSAATPYKVWDHQISGSSGFQLSTPLLVPGTTEADDVIYLASSLSDKYTLTNVSPTLPVTGVSSQTVTASIANLETASNRLAVGIKLSGSNVTGTADVDIGGTIQHLTLTANGTNTGTSYKPYQVEVHDPDTGTLTGYEYYWYINQNVSGTANSSATVTVSISLSGGTGDIQYLDVYANKSSVQKVTGLNATAANAGTVVKNTTIYGGVDGQINTPITTDGTYLYFGTYTGYNTSGTYYQITKTGSLVGYYTPPAYGFYWAGAVCDDNNVYFGSDNGMLYWRSINNFSSNGGSVDLKNTTTGVSDAGNVRSTIMKDGNNLYFTSQGGYLWICRFTNGTLKISKHIKIGGTSTSTPTKVGNRIYVGCYGATTNSGVQCIDISGNTPTVTYVVQGSTSNPCPVQCSIVVNGTGTGPDYLYYVTNAAAGAGYCCTWNGSSYSAIWDCSSSSLYHPTYALGGMAIDNGIAVYGNDKNYLYVIKQ